MTSNCGPAGVPPFPPGYRASGVLLHVTSLRSPYGIGDLPEYQRQNFRNYLKRAPGASDDAAPSLVNLAWSSIAALTVAPLQDLLNLGAESRMHIPGRPSGNWRWRRPDETQE